MAVNERAYRGFRVTRGDATGEQLAIIVPTTYRVLHYASAADENTDWNVSNPTHPTLYVHSETTPATNYGSLAHNATDFVLTAGSGSVHSASSFGIADDTSLELGADDDSVLRHRTATLAANTVVTDVLAGTPVAAALAANSLMISNITASGDIAMYVNTGTNSEQAVFIDGSASNLALGQTGWAVNVVEGAVKVTLGTVSAFGTTQPTNALVFRAGTAPVGAITTASALFASTTVLRKIIADGTASNVET